MHKTRYSATAERFLHCCPASKARTESAQFSKISAGSRRSFAITPSAHSGCPNSFVCHWKKHTETTCMRSTAGVCPCRSGRTAHIFALSSCRETCCVSQRFGFARQAGSPSAGSSSPAAKHSYAPRSKHRQQKDALYRHPHPKRFSRTVPAASFGAISCKAKKQPAAAFIS